jgi:hypothetical protein
MLDLLKEKKQEPAETRTTSVELLQVDIAGDAACGRCRSIDAGNFNGLDGVLRPQTSQLI